MKSHSSLNDKKVNDKTVVSDFISNTQSTHTEMVCTSVGRALLMLAINYFPKKDMTLALAINNYSSASGEDLKIVIEKKYNDTMKEIRKNHKAADYKDAICYLEEQAKDSKKEDREAIKLFLPIANTSEPGYEDRNYIFPIKLVIFLVWTALRDHDRYQHNYSGDQLTKARGDYSERTNSFFTCIESFHSDSLCRTGIRNELVFILNKAYLGIDLIEDVKGTILYELRNQIGTLFWEEYAKATPQIKKELSNVLFVWIGKLDSSQLLTQLNPKNRYNNHLSDLFIRHGINPETMQLDSKIRDALASLTFTDNTKNKYLAIITNILTSSYEDDNCLDRNAAVKAMRQWIYRTCNLADNRFIEELGIFYQLYLAQKKLYQYNTLLLAQDQIHESFVNLPKICNDYFQQYVFSVNNNQAFPNISSETIATIKLLDKIITACKASEMVNFIENFFARWFTAHQINNLTEIQTLYTMLLNEEIKVKIVLSPDQITSILASISDAELLKKYRETTPYELNRILLHGIYHRPADWSKDFQKLFVRIVEFIKKNFNESDDNHLATNLNYSSYKPVLPQTDYLLECSKGNEVTRPKDMLLLPDHVMNAEEWMKIRQYCNRNLNKFIEIYSPWAVKINHLAMEYIAEHNYSITHTYDAIKWSIPRASRYFFITNKLISATSPWFSNVDHWFILEHLLDDDKRAALYLLHEVKINSLIRSYLENSSYSDDSFKRIINNVPSQHLSATIISILKSLAAPEKFMRCFVSNSIILLPLKKRLNFLTVNVIAEILQSIPKHKRVSFLMETMGIDFVQSKLKKLSDFVTIMKNLPLEQTYLFLNRNKFLNFISNLLKNNQATLTQNSTDFVEILKLLTIKEGTSLITSLAIDLSLSTKILQALHEQSKIIFIQRLPETIAREFVGDFSKHYNGLRSKGFFLFTFFKTNWPKSVKIPTHNPIQDVQEIIEHSKTHNSRSKEAWLLMNGIKKQTPVTRSYVPDTSYGGNEIFSRRFRWDAFPIA